MTERTIRLDEHVGRVDADEWALADSECVCPYWLSDGDRFIILSHLAPFVLWPTRFVRKLKDDLWQTVSDAEFSFYQDAVRRLLVRLTGGDDEMGCNTQLSEGLLAIAAALRTIGNGGSSGGCGSGGSAVLNCLNGISDDQLLDTAPPGVNPYGETPPEGFETMEEYLVYKCQAAMVIIGWLKGFATGLQTFALTAITANTVGPLVAALLSALGVISLAFPPAAVVALVAAIVGVGVLSSAVFVAGTAFANYLDEHESDLKCALYNSGDASDALSAILAAVEDFIQGYGWSEAGAGTLFGQVMGTVQTNSLVAPLFKLVEDVAFPGADCTECIQQPGDGLWHFTAGPQSFQWVAETGNTTGQWDDDPPIPDPYDISAGCLRADLDNQGATPAGSWRLTLLQPLQITNENNAFYLDAISAGYDTRVFFRVIFDDETMLDSGLITCPVSSGWVQNIIVNCYSKVGRYAVALYIGVDCPTTGQSSNYIDHVWFYHVT